MKKSYYFKIRKNGLITQKSLRLPKIKKFKKNEKIKMGIMVKNIGN